MTSAESLDSLRMLLHRFVSGDEGSTHLAGEIEGVVASHFPGDERFEDLLDALASYRPGGGEFLYDEEALMEQCRKALRAIDSRSS